MYRTALATLALTFATGAVMASGAYAAPEWYTSSTPAAAEWQQGGKALAEARATVWKGNVAVTDGMLETTVECESSGEGSVGVGATGKVTAWTLSKCAFVKAGACSKLENVKALGVPWSTALVYSRGAASDTIKGESALGFKFTCVAFGIKVTDLCEVPTLGATAVNATGGVNSSFSSSEAKCSVEKGKGNVQGSELIEATTGGKLEVAGKEGPFTKVSGSLEVKSAGTMTIEDQGFGKVNVTCPAQTTGNIEAAGKGTIKSYVVTVGSCKSSTCESIGSVTAINLPWKTELHERGLGLIAEGIVSGGSGMPQWRFGCRMGGFLYEDTCNLNVNPYMLNGPLGNVDALFSEEKVNCSQDAHENEGVWRGELVVEHPSSVAEIAVK
jgi:hypothetical protein